VLQSSPLFEMVSPAELELAAEMSGPAVLGRRVVFEEGDLGDSLFVIASGEVEVLRRNERAVKVIQPGPRRSSGRCRSSTRSTVGDVRARIDSVLLQLTAENFAAFRKHHRDGFTFVS
jgi:CRP-like cAMP-binding protein